MKVLLIAICITIPHLTTAKYHRCPNSNQLSKRCTCDKKSNIVSVKCEDVKTNKELNAILKSFQVHILDNLTIKNSGPFDFNTTLFRKLYIQNLTFEEVQFNVFTMFYSLQGLEFTLEELHFVNCKIFSWFWTTGLKFSYLKTVHFENTTLPRILTNEIMAMFPKNIRKLQIIACSIKKLGNKALRRFSHLQELELDRNRLTVLKRSMFPKPARRLKYISLNKNRVSSLPEDIFHEMRRLEFLSLEETRLNHLSEETFYPVWEQLEEISFKNIELLCDCNSAWLISKAKTLNKTITFPICKSPYGSKHQPLNFYSYKGICAG